MPRLFSSKGFDKNLSKFIKSHPELGKKIIKVIDQLKVNPFDPKLKSHKLSGDLKESYSCSIDNSYRITFSVDGDILYVLSIGSHDDVY